MTNKIINKMTNNLPLTKKEINYFLNEFCIQIKKNYNINNPYDTNCKYCRETASEFAKYIYLKHGINDIFINIKELLNIPLTHYINILFVNINNEIKPYLIDMTYNQFFNNKIILDNGNAVSTKNTFKKMEEESFIKELRLKGFIELNEYNTKKYFDLFLDTCRVSDKSSAYYNINELLKNNIVFNNKSRRR